ncbi:MAG: T9SS type A sorting domain-containing protein [Ignavibacteria bacterium]|nr:T9SS type A sorting domain-containing protein [Ignavibacteria bacterium]
MKNVFIILLLTSFILTGTSYTFGNNSLLTSNDIGIGDPSLPSDDYKLYQNYPNPFNPTTKISFKINKEGFVYLSVFNLVGQEVSVLVYENKKPGIYEVEFDAQDIPSGIYLYKLQINGYVSVKRMTLIR